jgi:hypothetical protein
MGTIILLTVLFIVYALTHAVTEAMYQDYLYVKDRQHPNLHPVYVLERCIAAYLIFDNILPVCGFKYSLWFIFALACIYSFFHNGLLYTLRNILTPEIYGKRWWDNKVKGTDRHKAIWELNVYTRTIMFIFGIAIIIYITFQVK